MAGIATQIDLVSVVEWEIVNGKKRWLPAKICMTHLAALSKKSSVNLRLFMTCCANCLGLIELLVEMAITAYEINMFSLERENYVVIETHHSIDAVVAIGANYSKRSDVTDQKYRILAHMTALTGEGISIFRIFRRSMTIFTGEWIPGIISMMQ